MKAGAPLSTESRLRQPGRATVNFGKRGARPPRRTDALPIRLFRPKPVAVGTGKGV